MILYSCYKKNIGATLLFPSQDMERFYKVYPWSEDPESAKRRIVQGLDLFRKAVEHEWVSHLVKRRKGRYWI